MKQRRTTHPLYRRWTQMRQTVRNPRSADYDTIGGRGIDIDPRFDDFWEYVKLVEQSCGPCPGGSEWKLARKDQDKDFEPRNMEWQTAHGLAKLVPKTQKYRYLGKSYTLWELGLLSGINPLTIKSRICSLGWTVKEAVTRPVRIWPTNK